MTYLYIYRMTDDTGFAPCVDNDLLTLACCKGGQIREGKIINTGLRYKIGSKKNGVDYSTDNVYILGTYKDKLLYVARVTDVVTMEEYYSGMSKGRTDDIYSLKKNVLVRNDKLRKQNVHTDEGRIIRDIAGKYVLISEDFVYLGKDAVRVNLVEKNARFQETKTYTGDTAEEIVKECFKYRDGKKHEPTKPLKKNGGCS